MRLLLVAACLVLSEVRLFALAPDQSLLQYKVSNFGRQRGLPADTVRAVVQTPDGYIWLATQNGLLRFDSDSFANMSSTPEAPRDIVGLAPRAAGGVWVASIDRGFSSFDGKRFSAAALGDEATANVPAMIYEARDGAIFLSSNAGVVRVVPGEPEKTWRDPRLPRVVGIREDGEGKVWMASRDGWFGYHARGELTLFARLPRPQLIGGLEVDRQGRIWIGSSNGLLCFSSDGVPLPCPTIGDGISAMLIDRGGDLWIGTLARGLARIRNGVVTFRTQAEGLSSNAVTALVEDEERSLWVGTKTGLSQISDLRFPTITASEGLVDGAVHTVQPSQLGGLWITSSTGFCRYDGEQTIVYRGDELTKNGYTKLGFEAANGEFYWVDGDRNVNVLSDGKLKAQYPSETWPQDIVEDAGGLVFGIGDRLMRLERGAFRPFTYGGGGAPPLHWIHRLHVASDGSIWIGTVNGIFRVHNGRYQHWSPESQGGSNRVHDLVEDGKGAIWAGSLSGLLRIKDGKLTRIGSAQGLPDERVYTLVFDDLGFLWCAVGRGLVRARVAELEAVADGTQRRADFAHFDGTDSIGFLDRYDQSEFSSCKTPDGRLWFPNPEGVVVVDPKNVRTNRRPPAVNITALDVNGQRVEVEREHDLAPDQNEVVLHFDAISFIAPERMKVEYKLEGYVDRWIDAGMRRSAAFKLPPGAYLFRVRAANADGVWNETGASMRLTVNPHFYQTGAFYTVCILGVIAAVWWYIRRLAARSRVQHEKLRQQNELLEREVAKRSRQLVLASRHAGMADVAAWIIHDVGNVLNSVKVSVSLIAEVLRQSKATAGLCKVADFVEEHARDPEFISSGKAGKLPSYLRGAAEHLSAERARMQTELETLRQHVEDIAGFVEQQECLSRVELARERVSVCDLLDDAIAEVNAGGHAAAVHRGSVPDVRLLVDRFKTHQILVTLLYNAGESCKRAAVPNPRVMVAAEIKGEKVAIAVSDNGTGIEGDAQRVFAPQTRRHSRHALSLHHASLAVAKMHGRIEVSSGGAGCGAVFTLVLPIADKLTVQQAAGQHRPEYRVSTD